MAETLLADQPLADQSVADHSVADHRMEDSATSGGYDPAFFDQLARVEDRHFWFRARNRLIFELAKKISESLDPASLVLEVGCGTGNVLRVLEKACPHQTVVGMELWLDGLRYARKRSHAALVQADVRNWPFGRQAGLIGMFDVLEHIQEDQGTLDLLSKCLRPGGHLLLTVPAHQSLWSYFDEAARHCRRYSAAEIRRKLTASGFQVEFLSEFMASIFPLVWAFRKMRPRATKPDGARLQASAEFRVIPVLNEALTMLLTLESAWLASGRRLPVGTSLVVLAHKPGP